MTERLNGKTIAFLIASEGAEQAEVRAPWEAVVAEGGRPVLLAPVDEPGEQAQLFEHLDKAERMPVDVPLTSAIVAEYDALVLPGGVANPDFLRGDPAAVRFVWQFFTAGRPVAAICHAPWLLIEADVVRDRTLTSWPSLRTDLRNAGAEWVDRAAVVCEKGPNTLITSRKPDDLTAFADAFIPVFAA